MSARRHFIVRTFLVLVFWAAVGVTAAQAQNPNAILGSSVTPRPQPAQNPVWMPVFHFRSDFWVNLDHFLYLQARIQRGFSVAGAGHAPPTTWKAANLSGLSSEQRRAWQDAVSYYAKHFAEYSFPYDSFLVRVDNRLGQMGGCMEITGKPDPNCAAGIDPDLTKILEEAAPIYRTYWWPRQNSVNRAWIARASKLVHLSGGRPADLLAIDFQETWPADPIPVDITVYAGPYGAYTTLGPLHISISSADPRNQGPLALEVVFREASHVMAWPVEQAIMEQCRQETKAVPRDLWHALAFYTTARVFESAFANPSHSTAGARKLASFTADERAYVTAHGWQGYERLLHLYWQPYLDGHTNMGSAIENLVDAF